MAASAGYEKWLVQESDITGKTLYTVDGLIVLLTE